MSNSLFHIYLFWDSNGFFCNVIRNTNLGGDSPDSTDTILNHNTLVGGDIPAYNTNIGRDIPVHSTNLGEADDREGKEAYYIEILLSVVSVLFPLWVYACIYQLLGLPVSFNSNSYHHRSSLRV